MDGIIKDNTIYGAIVTNNQFVIQAISHKLRVRILELLSEKEMYPIELAKKMKMIEQKVYYHVNILKKAGLVKEVAERKMRGGKARLLKPTALAFGFVMKEARGASFVQGEDYVPFVEKGIIKARIIVGGPDPHGPHRARARDGHIAAEVAAFICRLGSAPWPLVMNDIELRDYRGSLILVGGPIVNTASAHFNDQMPVRFDGRAIRSPEKEYADDWVGFVAIADNPHDSEAKIMMIAGRSRSGTRAAALSLRTEADRILKKGYAVVQGFDETGDGIVDTIELLE
ncbi:MAG: helix-turn-helix domain-containing protein [Candidatus Altiarchaeota archaeon]|nr:helix-turn-helix domain-containing protein [Candidatus Altiarchaeota archaeon]